MAVTKGLNTAWSIALITGALLFAAAQAVQACALPQEPASGHHPHHSAVHDCCDEGLTLDADCVAHCVSQAPLPAPSAQQANATSVPASAGAAPVARAAKRFSPHVPWGPPLPPGRTLQILYCSYQT